MQIKHLSNGEPLTRKLIAEIPATRPRLSQAAYRPPLHYSHADMKEETDLNDLWSIPERFFISKIRTSLFSSTFFLLSRVHVLFRLH